MKSDPLHYTMLTAPEIGTPTLVADGIYCLRLPLPFALNHVNAWLLDDGDGWLLIDTGIYGSKSREIWDGLFVGLLQGKPIKRLLVTHYHPDHIGCAAYIHLHCAPELLMSRTEWQFSRMLCLDTNWVSRDAIALFYARSGLAPEQQAALLEHGNRYTQGVQTPPASYTRLVHGDTVFVNGDAWQVLTGGGHAPEHISLYCAKRRIFIAGDQVLPKISPNISVWAFEPDANPLAAFMDSLQRFRALAPDCLVLPSHGLPFHGLPDRLAVLLKHHEERLAQVADICENPLTANQVMPMMFKRDLDRHQTLFALGETIAHLNYLWAAGLMTREADNHGAWRYKRR